MATRSSGNSRQSKQQDRGLTRITVAGFKSIHKEQSIEVRPLTILAGANSSGKSSIMQPLLLLKQTIEANYDPGPLLLDGPNVQFTEVKQLLTRTDKGETVGSFRVGAEIGPRMCVGIEFCKRRDAGFGIRRLSTAMDNDAVSFTPKMHHATIRRQLPRDVLERYEKRVKREGGKVSWEIERERCFLVPAMKIRGVDFAVAFDLPSTEAFTHYLRNLIHLPALRGNPERVYPATAVGDTFSGRFDEYVASIIAEWQARKNRQGLGGINNDLRTLELSWKVAAERVSDAAVKLEVGRLPRAVRGSARDLVSIADVGFGVSQALPVVVALNAARSDQLVYLEQPEIHLHPRAQVAMATVLANAVKRGVRVVVETHSSLLLLAIQTLVAEGTLSPHLVKLHWFTRSDTDGTTTIRTADLDDTGAFGDWPEDFAEVEADIENRYLDAAEARISSK